MKYSASYDTVVKVVTTLIIILMLCMVSYLTFQVFRTSARLIEILSYIFSIVVLIGILLICYVYSPQYYILNDDSLIIKRIVKDRTIMLTDISELRLIEPVELRGVIRTFGVGGLFGYFGKFASLKLGSMTWYSTQRRNRVLMILKTGEKVVITPDEISLIDAIKPQKINKL